MIIHKKSLVDAMKTAIEFAEAKSHVPILSCVRLTAAPGGFTLRATNLEAEFTATVTGESNSGFDAVLMASDVERILQAVPGPDITIETPDGFGVIFSAEDLSTQVQVRYLPSPKDWPDFKAHDGSMFVGPLTFPGGALQKSMKAVLHAASNEETRYYLQGEFVEIAPKDGLVHLVATDGHKLERRSLSLPVGCMVYGDGDRISAGIIPKNIVDRIVALKGDVTIDISADRMTGMVRGDVGVIAFKMIESSFPDYERVIPKGPPEFMVVDAAAFAMAAHRVAALLPGKVVRSVAIMRDGDNGRMHAPSTSEGMSCTAAFQAQFASDDPAAVLCCNVIYLSQIMAGHAGITTFAWNGVNSPMLITSQADGLSVLMPMRPDKHNRADWRQPMTVPETVKKS